MSPPSPSIRPASPDDAPAAAAAIAELLAELDGEVPERQALEAAARELAADPAAGVMLLAEADDSTVGVLAASWQHAVHVPGRYGTIQDLWVHPEWRGRAVGRELVAALIAIAGREGVARLEVGLPKEGFDGIEATERFYSDNGFAHLGPRMRRLLR